MFVTGAACVCWLLLFKTLSSALRLALQAESTLRKQLQEQADQCKTAEIQLDLQAVKNREKLASLAMQMARLVKLKEGMAAEIKVIGLPYRLGIWHV